MPERDKMRHWQKASTSLPPHRILSFLPLFIIQSRVLPVHTPLLHSIPVRPMHTLMLAFPPEFTTAVPYTTLGFELVETTRCISTRSPAH